MRNKTLFLLLPFLSLTAFSQEKENDSINNLSEVVITGQYNAQSVKKSVFQVKVISREDIDRQAGNNLADLLNQTLNINIIPNASTGKSGVQLFGLDAQYFKILVDNIPIINDEGLGNNTDLTQINLDDIQQIEIVEGSMGVEYGANAVSGIINIITKKNSKYKWEITPYIQEETIGSEYNLVDRGRHIQSLKVGHNFNEKWYANAVVTTNDFKGFLNDKKGPNHIENDGLRGYEWLPKEQLNVKSLISYNLMDHRFFYKFEFFKETTDRFGSFVELNENTQTGTNDPKSADAIFNSERFFHHLNFTGKFENIMNYDASFSYQQQKRNVEEFFYWIRRGEKTDVNKFEYESRDGFYSKANFSNFLDNKTVDFQVGYEVSEINGYSSSLAGTGMFQDNIERRLGSYDVYGSSEININDKISIRPGIRALFSSQFDTQTALSLSSRFLLKNDYELRAIVGTSPRLPNYEELYTYLVDVNHNVQGNPDLNPEQGVSAFLHLNKTSKLKEGIQLNNKFSAWYIDVKDRIELVIVNETPLEYKYRNIDIYRTIGTSFTTSLNYKNWIANAGVTFAGVSKVLDSGENYNDDFLYGFQVNANLSYKIEKINTVFSAFVKYSGPQYLFVNKRNEANESILVRGKQDGFTWLDATVKKSFFKNNFEVTVGARNIMDITTINTTAVEGGAHSGPATNILMGYGRSYFMKLLYKLNF
ncbi:TonB-dependent receptor plug domain-containing protein [Flavobacterium sp. PLA-1-15]|uniref:TonB-dependent receptor plug domain-containing protein n=1 Tax=Flavobacterium sp. PLA-1-15 TaxID=3380533 RepID=UPI003B7FAE55